MAQTAVCAITQASETDAQWGSPEQPRWGCGGQACGAKRSETTTEGLSAMPTEGESVAND